ncbi:MAG: carbohydrate binding domain-containing protein [Armatimonadota bacterium]|nr:carbohydrate binding domain-containing protein [bacterium]
MSKRFCLVVCLALLLTAAVCAHAQNLVPDQNFSSLTVGAVYNGSAPFLGNGWLFNSSAGTATVVAGDHDGNCIKLTRTVVAEPWWNADSVLSTYPWYNGGAIRVNAGQQYSLSFWAKTDETSDSVVLNIAPLNSGDGYLNLDVMTTYDLTTQWQKITTTYTAPTNAACVQLSWRANMWQTGTVYLDDVSFAAVPEPASILAMLSGMVGFVGFAARKRK